MQLVTRRGGAILGSLMALALAGIVGVGTTAATNKGVDQQDLVGKKAPEFTLVDLEGNKHVLSDYAKEGKTVVLEWFNPTCPVVVRHYATETDTMDKLAKEYKDRDVVWLAINSGSDASGAADLNSKTHKKWEMNHTILRDTDGEVGKAYGAMTTPNMYVIDAEGVLRYAGSIDDNSRGRKTEVTNYVREALNSVLAGETVEVTYNKPYGCGVKY